MSKTFFRRGNAASFNASSYVPEPGEPIWCNDVRAALGVGNGSADIGDLFVGTITSGKGFRGPVSAQRKVYYGNGADGSLSISSGTTTLTADAYYTTLAISGTAIFQPNGYRVYCSVSLNLDGAPLGAIRCNGTQGNAGSGTAAGAGGAALVSASLGGSSSGTSSGGAGGSSGNNPGGSGTGGSTTGFLNGGSGGAGGAGGASATPNAGGSGATMTNTSTPITFARHERYFLGGATQVLGGERGGGGGGGGAVVGASGRGAGGGGAGGGVIAIYAKNVNRTATTSSVAIQCIGGFGGAGVSQSGGTVGSGGGGGGGGGGYVYICYETLTGTTVFALISAIGGSGGAGGSNTGTGQAGAGGNGGAGGRVQIYCSLTGVSSLTIGSAGSAASGSTGGTGGACDVTL